MTEENPVDIKINAKVSANFDPLIKATPKGVGRVFSLLFGRREADNLRYKMLTAAKTQKEYQQILSGEYTLEGDILVPIQNPLSIECVNILQIEEKQEIKNLAGNIHMAVEALKDIPDEQIPDQEIDEDFFARWRREAKVIGHEDLQRLWGRLLAEEIKFPGDISYRSLDVLKNIRSEEALIFQKITPYILGGSVFICNVTQDKLPQDISFDDIVLLKDCGFILNETPIFAIDDNEFMSIEDKVHCFVRFDKIIIVSMDINKKFGIRGIRLTSAGETAYSICDKTQPNVFQLRYLCEFIKHYNRNGINKLAAYKDIPGQESHPQLIYEYPENNS